MHGVYVVNAQSSTLDEWSYNSHLDIVFFLLPPTLRTSTTAINNSPLSCAFMSSLIHFGDYGFRVKQCSAHYSSPQWPVIKVDCSLEIQVGKPRSWKCHGWEMAQWKNKQWNSVGKGDQYAVIKSANSNANIRITCHGSVRVLRNCGEKNPECVWERTEKYGIGKTSGLTTRVISQTDCSPHQRGPAAMTLLPHYQPRLCPQR